jgi:hypothetical protein
MFLIQMRNGGYSTSQTGSPGVAVVQFIEGYIGGDLSIGGIGAVLLLTVAVVLLLEGHISITSSVVALMLRYDAEQSRIWNCDALEVAVFACMLLALYAVMSRLKNLTKNQHNLLDQLFPLPPTNDFLLLLLAVVVISSNEIACQQFFDLGFETLGA